MKRIFIITLLSLFVSATAFAGNDLIMPTADPLEAFSASRQIDRNMLTWVTGATATNNHYEVERSTDGMKFVYVGSVNSYFKTSTEKNHYSFLDPSPPGTHFYYRIKVRNIAGEISYSRTIQLSIRPLPFDLITVINPFNYRLRFDISSTENGTVTAELVNSSGIAVRKTGISLVAGMNRLSIDQTSDLPAGVYFLVIRKGEQQLRRTVLKSHR